MHCPYHLWISWQRPHCPALGFYSIYVHTLSHRTTTLGEVTRRGGHVSWGQPHPIIMGLSPSTPPFWGSLLLVSTVLWCIMTKFDVVTRNGRRLVSLEPQCSQISGVFPYLCPHTPFNAQWPHLTRYHVGEGTCLFRLATPPITSGHASTLSSLWGSHVITWLRERTK